VLSLLRGDVIAALRYNITPVFIKQCAAESGAAAEHLL